MRSLGPGPCPGAGLFSPVKVPENGRFGGVPVVETCTNAPSYSYPEFPAVEMRHFLSFILIITVQKHVFSLLKAFKDLLLGWAGAAKLLRNWCQIPQRSQ